MVLTVLIECETYAEHFLECSCAVHRFLLQTVDVELGS